MATTTAAITLTSSDLLTNALALSASMTLYQHNTTATGLDEVTYSRHNIPTGTNFDLIPESAALTEDASYVYISNKSTDVTYYVIISINAEVIGRLYAGDWMFIPWDCDLSAAANDSSIEVQAYTGENVVEYALFHNGETLLTAADS
jgi:DNA-binding beta-propeller fold protein YncE